MPKTAERGVGHVHCFVSPRLCLFAAIVCILCVCLSQEDTIVTLFPRAWSHSNDFDRSTLAEICVFAESVSEWRMKNLDNVRPRCRECIPVQTIMKCVSTAR